jgi:hypothetical protein
MFVKFMLGFVIDVKFVLYQFPRDSQHVSRCRYPGTRVLSVPILSSTTLVQTRVGHRVQCRTHIPTNR